MVGGRDYQQEPFNLATQGQRQPGSSIKPFTLAEALQHGYTPGSTLSSRKKQFDVPGTHGKEKFVVNNYEGDYTRLEHAGRRPGLVGQLDLRRARHQGRDPADRRPGRAAWASARRSPTTSR